MRVKKPEDTERVYFVRVDTDGKWTSTKFRRVTESELDELIEKYSRELKQLCSCGERGAMTMWAYFKSKLDRGCYDDMINAYRILSDDNKSLVDREHEFRHLYDQYNELWQIRYYGSVEEYHLKKANEAKERFNSYIKENGGL